MTTMTAQTFFARKAPKLMMYDLDGTLVDSVTDMAVAIDCMLKESGLPAAGEEKVRLWIGNGIPSLVKRALADDMAGDQPGQVEDALFEEAFASFWHHYDREVGLHSTLYPGVREFLETMSERGIPQVVVTNKPEQFTDKLLKQMDIHQHFQLFIGGDSLPEKKPHPMPLLHVMDKFSVEKHQTLMIGDSSNDIKAARAAEVAVVALPYGYNHGEPVEKSEPDLVVDCLSSLIA